MEGVKERSQAIGAFLDSTPYVLATYHEVECEDCGLERDELFRVTGSINDILAEHFGIDLQKVEDEKRAVLEYVREQNRASA
jgi:hypothetical protein